MPGGHAVRISAPVAGGDPDPGPASDAALVAAAQRDPAAFAALYDRYFDPIYRYGHHRLGDRTETEDVTSLIFARALAALPRYRAGSFRSWLFAIAHNTVVNHHRARRPERPLDEALAIADVGPAASPEALAVASDERRALWGALTQLSPDQRRVVELRLAGLTGPEIAGALGKSHAAVKMLQVRALDRLQELLGADARTEGEPDATR